MSHMKKALVEYRLEQAVESLESARLLLQHEKYRPSVNRSYYAMFYAVLALLALEEVQASKHTGVLALFDKGFVRAGKFTTDLSRWIHEAFDLRQRADYRELFQVTAERAADVLGHAEVFVSQIQRSVAAAGPEGIRKTQE
jgi:uncharacterized protein (UPF0332 family)